MTVTLDITPETEERLRRKAEREGQDFAAFLQTVVEREAVEADTDTAHLQAQRQKNQAALDLLNAWDEEDKTDDPKEIARRLDEWEAFKNGMNAAHTSNRVIYP